MDTLRDNPEVVWGFLLALAVVLLLTPGVGRFARFIGVVDEPGETRRVHTHPVPRLGGIALLLGIFVPALAFLELDGPYRGILLGAAIATTVGAIDDFRGLPWWGKLGGQVAAGAVAVGFGVTVDRFTFPGFGSQELPEWAAGAATIVWVVAIMNMVNFLDGMDGLAAGICAIAGSTFAIIGLSLGASEAALLAAIVAGACFGFLHHNFYPARIFMGDSGALLLGFLLATLAIEGLVKTAALATLVLPLLVLAIPIVDTSFVVAKRLKYRQPLYEADRAHLHHRFMNIGFSQKRAVDLHVRVVRDPRRGRARHALPAAAPARRLGPLERADRRRRGRPGRGRLDLHRVPPRDHQAGEPPHPPPGGAGAGGRAPQRVAHRRGRGQTPSRVRADLSTRSIRPAAVA